MINKKIALFTLAATLCIQQKAQAQKHLNNNDFTAITYNSATTGNIELPAISYSRNSVSQFTNSMSMLFDSLRINSVPVQISFTPGLSTQGNQSSRIINSFSLNVLGGETGGVSGFELGGLFNINKGYSQGLQIGGLFNLTQAYVQGVQIGGLYNKVGESVNGLQVAGIYNQVKSHVKGLQVAGIYNHAASSNGLQVAGITNTTGEVKGLQVAGLTNVAKSVNGLQVAGIVNRTKKLRGVQIGLINIADTSDGYSIGLVNIVPNGYHKLTVSTNEVMQVNAAIKTGTKRLYSMIVAGASAVNHEKIYTIGAGLGKEIPINKILSINPEASSQYVYLGSFSGFNLLNKFNLDLHLNIGKHLSLFGGPSFSAYYKEKHLAVPGYKSTLPRSTYNTFRVAENVDGWIGWNAGISFF